MIVRSPTTAPLRTTVPSHTDAESATTAPCSISERARVLTRTRPFFESRGNRAENLGRGVGAVVQLHQRPCPRARVERQVLAQRGLAPRGTALKQHDLGGG